jgi:hypothetical protein
MGQKVKLIWEYRGPEAQQIAEHYEHHLIEFIEEHKLLHKITRHRKVVGNVFRRFYGGG